MKKQMLVLTLIASLFTSLNGHNTAKLLGGTGALFGGAAAMAYCNSKIKKIEDTLLKQDPKSWNFVQEEALLREKNKLQLLKNLALVTSIIGGSILASELFQNNLAGGLAFLPLMEQATMKTPYRINSHHLVPTEKQLTHYEEKPVSLAKYEYGECEICYDENPQLLIPLECGCEEKACRGCLIEAINLSLKEKTDRHLQCPFCQASFTEQDLRNIFPNPTDRNRIEAIHRLKAFLLVQNSLPDDEIAVQCPHPDCPGLYNYKPVEGERYSIKCVCGNFLCLACGQLHEQNVTCEEAARRLEEPNDYENEETARRRRDEEEANRVYLAENTTPCPNCGTAIEKSGGCKRMPCRECGYQFCWICLRDWYHYGYGHNCTRRDRLSAEAASLLAKQPDIQRRIKK